MWRIISVSACIALSVIGCGPGGPAKVKLYPASGKVTAGGKPVTDCILILSTSNPAPGASAGYSGKLDANGQFTLADPTDGKPGAAPGKYKVTFTLAPEAAKKAMESGGAGGPGYAAAAAPFPSEYATASTSPKEVEIKAEENTLNIEL
jgi:hypothetical protein